MLLNLFSKMMDVYHEAVVALFTKLVDDDAFGMWSVSGLRRVPKPAAKIMACFIVVQRYNKLDTLQNK